MLTLKNIKGIATILLMICFVLPLSRCDRNEKLEAPRTANTAVTKQQNKRPPDPAYEDKYAYKNVSADDPVTGALTIAGFFWPLIFLAFGRKSPSFRAAMAINLGELLLCAGSAYMIFGITLFGDLRYGGYLAYLFVVAYLMSTLIQIFVRVRTRMAETCEKIKAVTLNS